jgi:hypothetical protein
LDQSIAQTEPGYVPALPWKGPAADSRDLRQIRDADGESIAICRSPEIERLIIAAVNTYSAREKLAEALRRALGFVDAEAERRADSCIDAYHEAATSVAKQIREALRAIGEDV